MRFSLTLLVAALLVGCSAGDQTIDRKSLGSYESDKAIKTDNTQSAAATGGVEKRSADTSEFYISLDGVTRLESDDVKLVVRCPGNRPELFVVWDREVHWASTVTFGVDDEGSQTTDWIIDVDKSKTKYPGDTALLLDKLMESDQLITVTTAVDEISMGAKFDLKELVSAIAPIRGKCEW